MLLLPENDFEQDRIDGATTASSSSSSSSRNRQEQEQQQQKLREEERKEEEEGTGGGREHECDNHKLIQVEDENTISSSSLSMATSSSTSRTTWRHNRKLKSRIADAKKGKFTINTHHSHNLLLLQRDYQPLSPTGQKRYFSRHPQPHFEEQQQQKQQTGEEEEEKKCDDMEENQELTQHNDDGDEDSFSEIITRCSHKRRVRFCIPSPSTSSKSDAAGSGRFDDDEEGRDSCLSLRSFKGKKGDNKGKGGKEGGSKENPPTAKYYTASPLSSLGEWWKSPEIKRRIWYTKKELAASRKDVQQTILFLRNSEIGADLFLLSSSSSSSSPLSSIKTPIPFCFRGCERYLNLETRYMSQRCLTESIVEAQKLHRDAVAEDQSRIRSHRIHGLQVKDEEGCDDDYDAAAAQEESFRALSESLSGASKELARWHANLNAYQCYGMEGLNLPTTMTSRNNTNTTKSREVVAEKEEAWREILPKDDDDDDDDDNNLNRHPHRESNDGQENNSDDNTTDRDKPPIGTVVLNQEMRWLGV